MRWVSQAEAGLNLGFSFLDILRHSTKNEALKKKKFWAGFGKTQFFLVLIIFFLILFF